MKARGTALDTIECPNCGHAIPVSEALSHQIAERARAETKAEIDKLQSALTRKEKELQEREER
jgi:ribosomal protein S26